jgi:hypothetical protein
MAISAFCQSPQQPQQSIQYRYRMRRAAGDVKVNRQYDINAVVDFRQITERAAAESAGANGNDDFRLRNGCVSISPRAAHFSKALRKSPSRRNHDGWLEPRRSAGTIAIYQAFHHVYADRR